jgi:hypothetical protein
MDILKEMPSYITGDLDFGLTDFQKNRVKAHDLIESDYETIEKTDEHIIGRVGQDTGVVFIYSVLDDLIDYYVKYEIKDFSKINIDSAITQIELWRRVGSTYNNMTNRIFFKYLIPTFKTVISDKSQTESGMNFWIDRMVQAVKIGYDVGIMIDNKVDWFVGVPNEMLMWINSYTAWGTGDLFKKRRFIINDK